MRGFYVPPYIWTEGEENEPRKPPLADDRLSDDHDVLYVKGAIIGGIFGTGAPPPYYPSSSPTASGNEHRRALSQLLTMWETEVVHMPLLRARAEARNFRKHSANVPTEGDWDSSPANVAFQLCHGERYHSGI